jgi:hypothetical protein
MTRTASGYVTLADISDGVDGVEITSIGKVNNTVTINYSDGTSDNFTVNGIASAAKVGDVLTITYDDGTTSVISDGDPGDGIANITRVGDIVTVTLDSGETKTYTVTDGEDAVYGDIDPVTVSTITKNSSGSYSANSLQFSVEFLKAGVTIANGSYTVFRSGDSWSTFVDGTISGVTKTLEVSGQSATLKATHTASGSTVSYPLSIITDGENGVDGVPVSTLTFNYRSDIDSTPDTNGNIYVRETNGTAADNGEIWSNITELRPFNRDSGGVDRRSELDKIIVGNTFTFVEDSLNWATFKVNSISNSTNYKIFQVELLSSLGVYHTYTDYKFGFPSNGVDGEDGYTPIKGVDYFDGVNGVSVKLQYSVNGSTNWHDTYQAGDLYVRSGTLTPPSTTYVYGSAAKFVPEKGVEYEDGIDGVSSYLHIAYADDASGGGFSQSPTGKEYLGSYTDNNPIDSTNPNDYTWVLIKGSDGYTPIKGVDYFDGVNGVSVKLQYSVNGSTNWHDTYQSGDLYVRSGTLTPPSTSYVYGPATKFVPEKGVEYEDGIDGISSYLHIAYADDASGNGFSQSPTGKDYLGSYTDSNPADSTNPNDYTWVKIKGEQGDPGEQGDAGDRGPGRWNILVTTLPTDNTSAQTAWNDDTTVPTTPIKDDQAWFYTGTQSNPTSQAVFIYNGTSWIEQNEVIDGNLLVTDTITASKVKIDNITLDSDGSGNLIIKTAGVATSQLALNAATVPIFSESASTLTGDTSATWQTALTASITLDVTSDVLFLWSFRNGYVSPFPSFWGYEFLRGSTQLAYRPGMTVLTDAPSGQLMDENLAAGSYTYTIKWRADSAGATSLAQLILLGVKR